MRSDTPEKSNKSKYLSVKAVTATIAIVVLVAVILWMAMSGGNKKADMKTVPAPVDTTAVELVIPKPDSTDTTVPGTPANGAQREKAAGMATGTVPQPGENLAPVAIPDTTAERLAAEEKQKTDEENARKEQARLDEENRIKAEQERQERLKSEEEKKRKFAGMVWIRGGTFMMGSNDGDSGEAPVHQVTVTGFYMDKYEVTQADFERVMGFNPSYFQGCPQCPVENVSWQEVMDYCSKVGAWLPTEAQWEYAARAGSVTRYYWGKNMNGAYAWHNGNSGDRTHPVGEKQPNAWGLYDMSGNVWEWCSDWYGKYDSSGRTDPAGPANGTYRVLRGGSWISPEDYLRSTIRYTDPAFRRNAYGFRCCRR